MYLRQDNAESVKPDRKFLEVPSNGRGNALLERIACCFQPCKYLGADTLDKCLKKNLLHNCTWKNWKVLERCK